MTYDSTLAALIRSGDVSREILMSFDNGVSVVRVWSGAGEITVDGDTYGGTHDGGLIGIAGVSDTAELQSHELIITLDGKTADDIGLSGFAANGADVSVVIVFLHHDGSVMSFRRVVFRGKIQSSSVSVSRHMRVVQYKARPPLLDLSQPRTTRYTSADQARRFAGDSGFDDVDGLTNKGPADWSPTSASGTTDVNVQWSASGGSIVLTDTAGRGVALIGSSDSLVAIECGATDRLGTADNSAQSGTYAEYSNHFGDSYPSWGYHAVTVHIWRQLGYGATVGPVLYNTGPTNLHTLDGINNGVEDFIGLELNADGYVYAGGEKVVVSSSNNRVYSAGGNLIVMFSLRMQNEYFSAIADTPSAMCSDIDQTNQLVNWRFVEVDTGIYLEAQAV